MLVLYCHIIFFSKLLAENFQNFERFNFNIFVHVCLCACAHVYRCQQRPEVLNGMVLTFYLTWVLGTIFKSLARTVTDNALNHWANLPTPSLNFRPPFLKARTVDQFRCKISHRVLVKLSARDPTFPVPSGREGSASKFFHTWLASFPFSLLDSSPSHWTGFFIATAICINKCDEKQWAPKEAADFIT